MRRGDAAVAVAGWLESTRGEGGYAGPVAHWWRDTLIDCRPGHDWRYEGVICGYLELAERTGDADWLARAHRAGDDLVAAQLPDGGFTRSQFEQNPGTGGTPHEAAADVGLLKLAAALAGGDPAAAERYRAVARGNLDDQIARLWDGEARAFRDDPARPSFVPNKACTLIEALLLLADATGDDAYVERYAVPTADAVLRHQVRAAGGRLDGAVAQNSFGRQVVAKYFPYYVARCVPGLLELARRRGDERYADAALAAGRFVARCREPDGGFPQVLYEGGRANRCPRWVAATGDVLRALRLLEPRGLSFDAAPTEAWLLAGILPNGAPTTARGFANQVGGAWRADDLPELRDLLPVAGWADKAFRYLAAFHEPGAAGAAADPIELDCTFLGRRLRASIGPGGVTAREGGRVVYRWRAGEPWAEAEPWLAVR